MYVYTCLGIVVFFSTISSEERSVTRRVNEECEKREDCGFDYGDCIALSNGSFTCLCQSDYYLNSENYCVSDHAEDRKVLSVLLLLGVIFIILFIIGSSIVLYKCIQAKLKRVQAVNEQTVNFNGMLQEENNSSIQNGGLSASEEMPTSEDTIRVNISDKIPIM